MSSIGRLTIALLCAGLMMGPAFAQTITSVSPEAADIGDEILIRGLGLGQTTQVKFTTTVPSIVGTADVWVTPTFVSNTLVKVQVPLMGYTPVFPHFPSSPEGSLTLESPLPFVGTATHGFYFYEGTYGVVNSLGLGSTHGLGHRAATSFDPANGLPFFGNSAFTLRLENAHPQATAALVLGLPAGSQVPYLDGILALDPTVFFLSNPLQTDADGGLEIPAPVPSTPIGVSAALSWIYLDPSSGVIHVANGLGLDL